MTPAPAVPTDAWSRFTANLSENLNPIVVKEVRQGLRTRVFWVFFGLMLLACLCISLVAWVTVEEQSNAGREFFIAYFVCLAIVQFFVIPYTAYRSMAREREDETWVLLTLTGLGPRRILRGKLSSFVVQGVLYASAAGPFLLFSYYLNGIDLPSIALAVALGAAYQLFLTSVSVSLATLAETRLVRGLMHFVLLGILLWSLMSGIGGAVGVLEAGRKLFGSDAFTAISLGVVFGMVTTAWLLFEAAAARLSLLTEDYAKGPRLVFMLQLFGATVFFLWAWLGAGRDAEVLVGAQVFACSYLLFVGLFVVSDHDGMGLAHWQSAGSRFALLRPGALRGYVLVLLCLLFTTVVTVGLSLGATTKGLDQLPVLLAAPAMTVIYLSLPMVLARWVPHHATQTPMLVRVFFLAVFLLGTGVPPLFAAMIGAQGNDRTLNALNPVIALVNLGKRGDALVLFVILTTAAVWATFCLLLLLRNDTRARDAATA